MTKQISEAGKLPEMTVREAAQALLNAYGGDTPSWLREEASALENALSREAVSEQRKQPANTLRITVRQVAKVLDHPDDQGLVGVWAVTFR